MACSDEDDEIVLRSRRRQHRLMTPEVSEHSEEEEAPGAPVRKRRRILPWTAEGVAKRGPWVGQVSNAEETEEEEEEQEDAWIHGQTQGTRVIDVLGLEAESEAKSEAESEWCDGLQTEDNCSDFVVDDDSDSVVEEAEAADRELGRGALEEARATLAEAVDRLERKVLAAKRKVLEFDEQQAQEVVPETQVSDESDEVVEEQYCRARRQVELETCYPWEDVVETRNSC